MDDILCKFESNLYISDNIYDDLLNFRESIHKLNKLGEAFGYSIIIDDMDRDSIDIYLEGITEILKLEVEMINDNKIINLKNYRFQKERKNSVLILDIDKILDFEDNYRFTSEDISKLFLDSLNNNNILIIASTKPLNDYNNVKRSDVLHTVPAFSFHGDLDCSCIYERLIDRYQNNKINYNLTLDEFKSIYDSSCNEVFVRNYNSVDFFYKHSLINENYQKNDLVNKDNFTSLVEDISDEEIVDDDKTISIDQVIGLNNVKNELNSLFNYAKFIKRLNINKEETYLNMLFLGSPGTGKTMVANIIANKLYEMGYLEDRKVVKVVPNDFTGEYVGHTRNVTRKILDKARGRLLFIDEAYQLCFNNYKNGKNPFMEEAMIELLKYLEDPKNIVVFAGYKNELRKIYNSNPGIKSRIYKEIIFKDYTTSELYKILKNDLVKKGLSIDKGFVVAIQKYIIKLMEDKNFGNARSMKQLSQKLIMNHANRCLKDDNLVIDKYDIPSDFSDSNKRIGFGVYDGR